MRWQKMPRCRPAVALRRLAVDRFSPCQPDRRRTCAPTPHGDPPLVFALSPLMANPVGSSPRLERSLFAEVPGTVADYGSRQELLDGLRGLLQGVQRLAVDYSPKGRIADRLLFGCGHF
jgi:hypothetical protein